MLPTTNELDRITTEILIYKQQTASGIIEIGKRLIEAKELLPHGEWGKWLEEEVEFNHSTATRFMRVAKECSNNAPMHNLGTGKIFALLDLPQEQREPFIQQNPVDEMTVKELREAIKAQKEAERKASEAEENLNRMSNLVSQLNKEITEMPEPKTIEIIKEIVPESVKNETLRLTHESDKLQKEIATLQRNLREAQTVPPEHIKKRLNQLETQNKEQEVQLKSLLTNPEMERQAMESKASMFTGRINLFLSDMGSLTYIGQEVISATSYTKQEYDRSLSQMEKWCREMRGALSELRDKPQIIEAELC